MKYFRIPAFDWTHLTTSPNRSYHRSIVSSLSLAWTCSRGKMTRRKQFIFKAVTVKQHGSHEISSKLWKRFANSFNAIQLRKQLWEVEKKKKRRDKVWQQMWLVRISSVHLHAQRNNILRHSTVIVLVIHLQPGDTIFILHSLGTQISLVLCA